VLSPQSIVKGKPFAPDARMKTSCSFEPVVGECIQGALTYQAAHRGVFIYPEPRAADHRHTKTKKHIIRGPQGAQSTCRASVVLFPSAGGSKRRAMANLPCCSGI